MNSHDTQYTPFIVLGQARTGSTLLLNALYSCPQLAMESEIFNHNNRGERGGDFDLICADLLRAQPISIKAVGCKIFYSHLSDEEWSKFLTLRKFKIIHLVRRNPLRSYLSLSIAKKTDRWAETMFIPKPPLEQRQVQIDKRQLIRFIRLSEFHAEEARQRFKAHEVLDLSYEDMVADFPRAVSEVLTFIGVTQWDQSRITLRKQNPESMRDLIINFDALKSAFSKTRWRAYFDEA